MKNAKQAAIWAIGAAVPLALSTQAYAAFDNFDADLGFNFSSGDWVDSGAMLAYGFQSASAGEVTDIFLALGYGGYGDRMATIRLHADNAGMPGSVLGSWMVTGLENFGQPFNPAHIAVDSGLMLSAGETYWLSAAPPDASETGLVWGHNVIGDLGPRGVQWWGGAWSISEDVTRGAFAVVIPAPASALALATLALATNRRRR